MLKYKEKTLCPWPSLWTFKEKIQDFPGGVGTLHMGQNR